MARFEIEAAVKNAGGVKGDIAGISNSLDKLNDRYSSLTREIAKSTAVSRGLEGELKSLNSQFKAGTISQSSYEKQTIEVSEALASARQATGGFQSQLTSLKATTKQNETGLDQYGNSVKKLEGYHKSFAGGIRSSSSVAIEFGRIIQDAPYGIQGVANNLQQLTTNFGYYAQSARQAAAESGKTLTKMQLLQGAFAGILSPVNLLTIGVSVVTAGWVAYQKWGQKAKKTTDDNKKSFDDLVKSLDEVRAALAQGEANSQKQITDLRLLYAATQNATLSIDDRRKAVDELQKQYPSYFGNLKDEKILAGEASGAYDTLAKSILATSQARASADAIAEGAKEQLVNRIQIEQQQELLNIAQERLDVAEELKKEAVRFGTPTSAPSAAVTAAERERNKIGEEINRLGLENEKIGERNKRRTEEITALIQEGADVTLNLNDNVNKVNDSLKETKDILDKKPLSPLEVSIKNAFDDLLKVRSQLEKIYNADAFNPFDLSGIGAEKGKGGKDSKADAVKRAEKNDLGIVEGQLGELSDFAGSVFASFLTDGTNAADNIAKSFKSMVNSIIQDLIRLAAQKALLNIFSGGASGLLGGLFKGIGKIFGFADGGYTGNRGTSQAAGIVHGQEYVINAAATKKYRSLLDAMNSGQNISSAASSVSTNISNEPDVIISETRIDGSDLVVVYKRADKAIKRYGS